MEDTNTSLVRRLPVRQSDADPRERPPHGGRVPCYQLILTAVAPHNSIIQRANWAEPHPDEVFGKDTVGTARKEISRFPCEEVPYVHGVYDHARPCGCSPGRARPCCLPHKPTGSAPSRATRHDPGPVWMADPSPDGSFIRSSSPPSRRSAQGPWTPWNGPAIALFGFCRSVTQDSLAAAEDRGP